MKKINIGRKIYDVIDENEFIRRTKTNPEIMKELATDTAVEKNGTVYPVSSAYSKDNLAVTEYAKGNVLMYSNPQDFPNKDQYQSENIIDFDNVSGGFSERIRQVAKLEEAERSILVLKDNVYNVPISDQDTPEMKLFKTALNKKNIDLLSYKSRFQSDYSNDIRVIQGDSITFGKLKKLASIFDMDVELTIKDKPNVINPIGEVLQSKIND